MVYTLFILPGLLFSVIPALSEPLCRDLQSTEFCIEKKEQYCETKYRDMYDYMSKYCASTCKRCRSDSSIRNARMQESKIALLKKRIKQLEEERDRWKKAYQEVALSGHRVCSAGLSSVPASPTLLLSRLVKPLVSLIINLLEVVALLLMAGVTGMLIISISMLKAFRNCRIVTQRKVRTQTLECERNVDEIYRSIDSYSSQDQSSEKKNLPAEERSTDSLQIRSVDELPSKTIKTATQMVVVAENEVIENYKAKTKKKGRPTSAPPLTVEQTLELKKLFDESPSITAEQAEEIAERMGRNKKKILTWWKNEKYRRAHLT